MGFHRKLEKRELKRLKLKIEISEEEKDHHRRLDDATLLYIISSIRTDRLYESFRQHSKFHEIFDVFGVMQKPIRQYSFF